MRESKKRNWEKQMASLLYVVSEIRLQLAQHMLLHHFGCMLSYWNVIPSGASSSRNKKIDSTLSHLIFRRPSHKHTPIIIIIKTFSLSLHHTSILIITIISDAGKFAINFARSTSFLSHWVMFLYFYNCENDDDEWLLLSSSSPLSLARFLNLLTPTRQLYIKFLLLQSHTF